MKSAIVTGANGFVGCSVVRELLKNKINVCAVVHNGHSDNLPQDPLLKVVSSDLSHIDELDKEVRIGDYEVFYHFAWMGSAGLERTDYSLQLRNAEYSLNAIKTAKKIGCSKFVSAGTIMEHETILSVYEQGSRPGLPYVYGAGKTAFHLMAQPLAVSLNIDLIWTEITNAYGPGEKSPRLVNSTIRKCIKGIKPEFTAATQNYDFVYIDDLARAYRLIGEHGKPFHRYLIGSSNAKPLRDYLLEMQHSISPDLDFIFGSMPFSGIDLPLNVFDTSRTIEDTGFKAEISFGEGCKRTMNWIMEYEGENDGPNL